MARGSVRVAMTRASPPHWGQRLMSMPHTRCRRAIQLIAAVPACEASSSARGQVLALADRNEQRTVARAGGEQTVVTNEVSPGPRHQRSEAGDEVLGLEQHVGGATAKGAFELEHHQPVAIDAESFLGNGRPGHVAA